jgi:gamma-glutamyltranspeptidase / glutathione hydrolase
MPRRRLASVARSFLFLTAAFLLLVVLAIPAKGAFPPSAEGAHVAVATDHSEATEAAFAILRGGGNAVDAAVGAALTLGVVNPTASGLGGGGFAIVYMAAEHKAYAFDFRETAPAHVDPEELFARAAAGFMTDRPHKRGASVGVPGEPAGLELLAKRFGKLPLARDAAPAAKVAQRGFPVGRHLAVFTRFMATKLAVSPELAAIFLPSSSPVPYRAMVTRPDLAKTLQRFGAEGSTPFYQGDIAGKVVSAVTAAGGAMNVADFAAYKVKERVPWSRAIDGRTVFTMPAPSAGSLMLLEILQMYGAAPGSALKPMGFGSSHYLHTLAEAMRGAIADRIRFAGDPDAEPNVMGASEYALSPEQTSARRARILPNRTHEAAEFRTREHGTTHLAIADADGNVVSLTSSINDPFGARIVAGDTGIVLNNQLDDFSAPTDIRGFGVVGLGPNRPRSGVRPVSSMTPVIVLENGQPILAVGGSGGERIATAVTQATLARLVFGLDPSACVGAPRIHVGSSGTELLVEPEVPEDVRQGLHARGETVKEELFTLSAVQMIAWDHSGAGVRLLAASDPRKVGFSAAE